LPQPDLTVVLPVFNEAETLPELRARLVEALSKTPRSFEVLLVDDGSRDRSYEVAAAFAREDVRFRALRLSRNFGHQMALTAGVDAARGSAVAVMDADLQDPPELLPEMLRKMEEGYEVVYAVRTSREGETLFKKATAHLFYRLIRRWTTVDIPVDAGDFRVMGPRATAAFRTLRERHRFVRGLASWVGFRQAAVPYARPARRHGETKFPVRKMLRFALDAVTSFSYVPLQLGTWLGFAVSLFAFLYILVVLALKLLGINERGWTTLMGWMLLLGGVQLMLIGVLGEYLGRIYDEVKGRPLYIVAEEAPGPGVGPGPGEGEAPPQSPRGDGA
jgi:dolichol-phosphate mannosyltransferase